MKVLVVSSKYPPEYAGSGLRAHNTYKRLASKYALQFDVLASAVTFNHNEYYTHQEVQVRRIANKWNQLSITTQSGRFRKIVNKLIVRRNYWFEAIQTFQYLLRNAHKYDVLHVFGNVNVTSATISYAKISGKPLLVELVNLVDDPHQFESSLLHLLGGKRFPKNVLIICISEALRQTCLKHGYYDKQLWCRPNPVDESRFFFEADKKQHRQGSSSTSNTDIHLLYLAKFMPLKNQLFLIDVMKHLPENYNLLLIGPLVHDGPLSQRDQRYYQSIVDEIKASNLDKRVSIQYGYVANPELYIKAANVFVMPTTREALGTPVLEALACGVPVVANDLPGVFDQWVEDGTNGYICELNAEKWAGKIQQAAQISVTTMEQASKSVLQAASTRVIDEQYYQHLSVAIEKCHYER